MATDKHCKAKADAHAGEAPRDDEELQSLLREAAEALSQWQTPCGEWGGSLAEETPGAPGSGNPWERLDAESAFWLLFPPRGNA